jgi:hypothetical protein
MTERILTLHPEGKSGVKIDRHKYDQIKSAIIESLEAGEEMQFKELRRVVLHKLEGSFEGSISWYYTTVKLDLEARGQIERVSNKTPQMLRLRRQD